MITEREITLTLIDALSELKFPILLNFKRNQEDLLGITFTPLKESIAFYLLKSEPLNSELLEDEKELESVFHQNIMKTLENKFELFKPLLEGTLKVNSVIIVFVQDVKDLKDNVKEQYIIVMKEPLKSFLRKLILSKAKIDFKIKGEYFLVLNDYKEKLKVLLKEKILQ